MTRNTRICVAFLAVAVVGGMAFAQFRGRRGGGGYRGGRVQDLKVDRNGVELWDVDPNFTSDVFTFARVEYGNRFGYGRDWLTDYPDSDLNFSFRLQQLTSLKVNPFPETVKLTDDNLFDFPFIYMIEPGNLELTEEEVVALRRYLFNGGFMMVDDFWGEEEWLTFYEQIKRVFPDREPEELEITHPIFSTVYKLTEKPQVPSINHALGNRGTNITWERGRDTQEVHYKGIFDDNGRMMVIICHNTDLGDGWEREGEDHYYFKEFAEKKAYPMGINIVFYAMTH